MNNVLPSSSTGNDESRMMNDEQGTSSAMRGGFSIMEVLIAVMIIGILAVILVPVLTSRAREARVAACESELQTLAEAQKSAAVLMGVFLRLYALNDMPGPTKNLPLTNPNASDSIADEAQNSSLYTNPKRMFIDPATNAFLPSTQADQRFESIVGTTPIVNETSYAWKGPFCNFKRDEKPNESQPTPAMALGGWTLPTHIHGIPNDPWGNDYLLFTRWGLVCEPVGSLESVVSVDAIGYSTVVFDRPTILSLGPNGKPGDETAPEFGKGDDIYRSFEY
jgi:prepilin-type N-terminal cleavage/methylation domain-containing protein